MSEVEPLLPESFSLSDIDSVCRICLLPQSNLCSIFESEIDILISAFIPTKVDKNDGFPHQICIKCYKDVRAAYFFKRKCENSYNLVRKVLRGMQPRKVVACNLCSTTFSTNSNLKRHLKNIHGLNWEIGRSRPDIPDSDSIGESFYANNGGDASLDNFHYDEKEKRQLLNFDQYNFESSSQKNCDNKQFSKSSIKIEKEEINIITPKKYQSLRETILASWDSDNEEKKHMFSYLGIIPTGKASELVSMIEQKRCERVRAYKILKTVSEHNKKYSKKNTQSQNKVASTTKQICSNYDEQQSQTYECVVCSMQFQDAELLKRHVVNQHSNITIEEPYQCTFCKTSFSKISELTRHVRACEADPRKPYADQLLFQTIHKNMETHGEHSNDNDKNNVEYNVVQVEENESNFCEEENFNYDLSQESKAQEETNDSIASNEGTELAKNFKNPKEYLTFLLSRYPGVHSQLVREQLDSIERNENGKYPCEICEKDFSRKSHLQRHYLTHTSLKPFKCDFCPSKFSCPEYVQTHMNRVHINPISSSANISKHSQYNSEMSNYQIKTEESNSARRNPPNYFRSNFDQYYRHTKPNPPSYSVPESSPQSFSKNVIPPPSIESVTNPISTINKRPPAKSNILKTNDGKFQCKYCPKIYNKAEHVRRHELLHTKSPKQFKCKFCLNLFTRIENLRRHFISCSVRKDYELAYRLPIPTTAVND